MRDITIAIRQVAVEEAIGLVHPQGLLVVSLSWAGAVVKRAKLTVAAVGKIAISISGTSSLTYTIGL